jgi:hypothetical protein
MPDLPPMGATAGLAIGAAGVVPFTIRCPRCSATADVAAVGYRMTVTAPGSPPPSAAPSGRRLRARTVGYGGMQARVAENSGSAESANGRRW